MYIVVLLFFGTHNLLVSDKKCWLKLYRYCKAIVLLQILKVLSNKAIQELFCKRFESTKRFYHFKSRNLQSWSNTSTFTPKNLNRQSICIISNSRIFKGESIQVRAKQFWIGKAIVSFQTPEFLKVKRYKYFHIKNLYNLNQRSDWIASKPVILQSCNVHTYYSKRLWSVWAPCFCVGG